MHTFSSVVDPDRVESSLFFRIRISWIRIGINSKQMIMLINLAFWKQVIFRKFQHAVQNTENYDTFGTDETLTLAMLY